MTETSAADATPQPGVPVALPSRAVALVATLGALVLLAGVALSARGPAAADLPSVIALADEGTLLVTASGSAPARRGARVPDGATVVTPAGGTAVVSTDGRQVRLAPSSRLVVLDGARQRLDAGSALVVGSGGPDVALSASTARVTAGDDDVVRVERANPVRVAAYAGTAEVGVQGRRARTSVGALRQVEVSAGALPGRRTPLRLTAADPWEAEQLGMLVQSDAELQRLVRALRGDAGTVAVSLPASQRGGSDVRDAERTLAYALAHVGGTAFRTDLYSGLLEDRALGGSWGVVAALRGAAAGDAASYLDRSLPGATPGAGTAPVLAAAPLPASVLDDVLGGIVGAPTAPGSPAPAPGPNGSPAPAPGPTPTPRPGLIEELVDAVLDLLPLPDVPGGTVPGPAVPGVRPAPAQTSVPSRAPLVEVEVPLVGGSLSVG